MTVIALACLCDSTLCRLGCFTVEKLISRILLHTLIKAVMCALSVHMTIGRVSLCLLYLTFLFSNMFKMFIRDCLLIYALTQKGACPFLEGLQVSPYFKDEKKKKNIRCANPKEERNYHIKSRWCSLRRAAQTQPLLTRSTSMYFERKFIVACMIVVFFRGGGGCMGLPAVHSAWQHQGWYDGCVL